MECVASYYTFFLTVFVDSPFHNRFVVATRKGFRMVRFSHIPYGIFHKPKVWGAITDRTAAIGLGNDYFVYLDILPLGIYFFRIV